MALCELRARRRRRAPVRRAKPFSGHGGRRKDERAGRRSGRDDRRRARARSRPDADGRFTFEPSPAPPFQVIVVLAGGQVARPVLITTVDAAATVKVNALADESVTVLGAAPSIDASPGAATTLLSNLQIARRAPENLMQALETVPGINQVSEGHAAVPAIRGLARGRDAVPDRRRPRHLRAPGRAERARSSIPSVLEGIDVARGPGSVAYGSDALGGVISVRTRERRARQPAAGRAAPAPSARGIPDRRGSVEVSKGFAKGGVLVQAHVPQRRRLRQPGGRRRDLQLGLGGRRLPRPRQPRASARACCRPAWQSDFGRDFERPRNNSRTVRFYYPFENSHRFTTSYDLGEPWRLPSRLRSPASSAPTTSAPTRIASPPRPPGAASSAPTSRPTTSTSRAARRRASAAPGSSSAST